MKTIQNIGILTILLTATVAPGIARADIPGNHPHYLHARSDLRKAEQLLQLPDEANVKQEERIAVREIRAAIKEINRASVLDRKDVDHPPIDTSLRHRDKFNEIVRLIRSAKHDLDLEEDNRAALSWRHRAETNLDRAEQHVELAAKRDRIDDHQ